MGEKIVPMIDGRAKLPIPNRPKAAAVSRR
jgi:hypothetical protein